MKVDCIRKWLSKIFHNFGMKLSRYPLYFIILPMVTSLALSIGIFSLSMEKDIEGHLTSDRGKIFNSRQFVEKMFPVNTSRFLDIIRYTKIAKLLVVMFLKIDNGNMLDKSVLREIKLADEIVKNTSITIDDRQISYSDVCGVVHGKCFENPIFKLILKINDIISKRKKIKFPVDIDPFTYSLQFYALNLGAVETDEDEFVRTVGAIRLFYYADESNKNKIKIIEKFTEEVYKRILSQPFEYIRPLLNPVWSIEEDTKLLTNRLNPLLASLMIFISVFCMISYMSMNFVSSKPWLGIASVVSAGLAIIASFGLMGLCGVENTYWNICIPFLVIVTEIDDAFVLIACWRVTNPQNTVEKRMADTFSEAGISITLTSLTNLSSYCIGMLAPFPLIRIFCYYSATCIFFTYLFQITFFAGCMAISGYREQKCLHPFTLQLFASETNRSQDFQEQEEIFMTFFRDKLGYILSSSITKTIVIILYLINLSFGIWGIFSLKYGLELENIYPHDSPIGEASRVAHRYFNDYSLPIHIVINETLDYSDIKIQKEVEELIGKFESHPHVADSRFTVSWLKYYKEFQSHAVAKYSLRGYNMSDKHDFLDGLRNVFLKFRAAQQFSKDIIFNSDESEIVCSRFLVITKNFTNTEVGISIIDDMWKIAEESKFSVLIHHPFAHLMEQGIIINKIVYQLIWVTSILIMVIFVSFVPNIFCSIVVAISVVSSITETIGFMSLWGMNLDIISMMSFILCVGFCVNYPTHISFAFVRSTFKSSNEKLKDSLYHIGFPIFQGSLSTIFGILFLYRNVYYLQVFIKVVTLIILETTFHSMLFIPVVLSLMNSAYQRAHLFIDRLSQFRSIKQNSDN